MPSKSRRKAAKSSQSKRQVTRRQSSQSQSAIPPDTKMDDEQSVQDAETAGTARIGFLSIPIEVRHMIYRMLFTNRVVEITAASMTRPWNSPISHTFSIIYVNKEISEEALPILYSSHTFIFDDDVHSPFTDVDVLRSFFATVRPHLVASITKMTMATYLRMRSVPNNSRKNKDGTDNMTFSNFNYASNFREMCQLVLKNMPGLRDLDVHFGPKRSSIHALRLLSRTATLNGLATSVQLLTKLPKLKGLTLIDRKIDGFMLLIDTLYLEKQVSVERQKCHFVLDKPPFGTVPIGAKPTQVDHTMSWKAYNPDSPHSVPVTHSWRLSATKNMLHGFVPLTMQPLGVTARSFFHQSTPEDPPHA